MKSNLKLSLLVLTAIISVSVAVWMLLAGCARNPTPCCVDPSPPIYVIGAIDISFGTYAHWGGSALMTEDSSAVLRPDIDSLTLYEVDRRATPYYDQVVGENPYDVSNAVDKVIKTAQMAYAHQPQLASATSKNGKAPKTGGTFPEYFWSAVAAKAAHETRPVIVIFFTDGDDDDETPASKQAIRQDANTLAANPNVLSVMLYGVNPSNYEYLESVLAPLGPRLSIHGATDGDETPILTQITQAQNRVVKTASASLSNK